jgi:hypothetical protein
LISVTVKYSDIFDEVGEGLIQIRHVCISAHGFLRGLLVLHEALIALPLQRHCQEAHRSSVGLYVKGVSFYGS